MNGTVKEWVAKAELLDIATRLREKLRVLLGLPV
jgi:hypothetical protein